MSALPGTGADNSLSVIVISKDDLPGLQGTLRSIEAQTVAPDEVLIVTKGDSDRIDLADFSLRGARHVVQQDRGISAAFNLALSMARCDWVNFLNGGDRYVDSNVLQRLQPHLRPEHDIVAARARDRLNGNVIPRDLYFSKHRIDQVSHQASMFRRALFKRHGDYSSAFRIRMDFEWMLRVACAARVDWVDDVIVDFEGGGASSVNPWQSCMEELRALRLHRAPWSTSLRLIFLFLPYRMLRAWLRSARTT